MNIQKINDILNEPTEQFYMNEKYYFITDDGCIAIGKHVDTPDYFTVEDAHITIGNYFKTEEEAAVHINKLQIEHQLKELAFELNGNKKIEWNKPTSKYCLYLHTSAEGTVEIMGYVTTFHKVQGSIYCLDPNFKRKAIDIIGKDLLIEYLENN